VKDISDGGEGSMFFVLAESDILLALSLDNPANERYILHAWLSCVGCYSA